MAPRRLAAAAAAQHAAQALPVLHARRPHDLALVSFQPRPLSPAGVTVDVAHLDLAGSIKPSDSHALAGAGQPTDIVPLRSAAAKLVADYGLVVLTGTEALTPELMTELMTTFGSTDDMLDYSTTPRDFDDDGLPGAVGSYVTPDHPRVRLLGNSKDASTGRPAALLANIGYEWHVDLSTECVTMLHCVRAVRGADSMPIRDSNEPQTSYSSKLPPCTRPRPQPAAQRCTRTARSSSRGSRPSSRPGRSSTSAW